MPSNQNQHNRRNNRRNHNNGRNQNNRRYQNNRRNQNNNRYHKSEGDEILKNFPNVELSYERIAHKIVQNSTTVFLSIPYGQKYFAWFNNFSGTPKCIFMEIDRRNQQLSNFSTIRCAFDESLCQGRGTIVYGTRFSVKKNNITTQFFNTEDIHYFKGKYVGNQNPFQKFKLFAKLFDEECGYIEQVTYLGNEIVFGLPIIAESADDIIRQTPYLPYQLYSLQSRELYKNKQTYYNHKMEKFKCPEREGVEAVFEVSADVMEDVYYLHTLDAENFRVASIQSYKQSVMMNKLFRCIRENDNLDYLEESDDEDMYQNCDLDKYLNKKRRKMLCRYHKKFKKWIPLREILDDERDKAYLRVSKSDMIESLEY